MQSMLNKKCSICPISLLSSDRRYILPVSNHKRYVYKVKLWKLKGNAYEKLQYLLSLGWVKFHYIYKTGPTEGTLRYATGTLKYIPSNSIPSGNGDSKDSNLYTTYFDSGRNEWRCAFNNYITFIGAELTRETKLFDKEHNFELK